MSSASNFKTLGLKLRSHCPLVCHVVVKEHQPQKEDGSDKNAIFVAGLPLAITTDDLTNIFSCFGEVVVAVLHPSKKSGMVVFNRQGPVKSLMAAATSGQIIEYDMPEPEGWCGLKAWVERHKGLRPGSAVLQQQIDDWMTAHEEEVELERQRQAALMHDEGWTLVVRGKGKKKTKGDEGQGPTTASGGVAQAAAATMLGKRKSTEFTDFYRFQQRQKTREELLSVREKFEEDKKKIARMKANRTFKPM